MFWGTCFDYTYGVKGKEFSIMEEVKEKERKELTKEEIDVYAEDCGEIQNHCKHDCFGGGSFLNPDY